MDGGDGARLGGQRLSGGCVEPIGALPFDGFDQSGRAHLGKQLFHVGQDAPVVDVGKGVGEQRGAQIDAHRIFGEFPQRARMGLSL